MQLTSRPSRLASPATLVLTLLAAAMGPVQDVQGQSGLAIAFGENLNGTIACGQTDTFAFDAEVGDRVVVHVVELSDFGGVCGGACLCFDQLVEVQAPDGATLDGNASPTSNNTRSRFRTRVGPTVIPATGTYSVSVRDKQNNGRGEYRIFLQRTNAPTGATTLLSGEEHLATVNNGAVHTYEFDAWPRDLTTVVMAPEGASPVVPRVELYDPVGNVIALPDSGLIELELADGGLFSVLGYSAVDESGDYTIQVDVQAPPPNRVPDAVDDLATTPVNTVVAVDVLANDTDPDGDELAVSSATDGANGTVVHNGAYLAYEPNTGFQGTDQFSYTATDGTAFAAATVTVTVTEPAFTGVPLVVSAGAPVTPTNEQVISETVTDLPVLRFGLRTTAETAVINSVVLALTKPEGDVGVVRSLAARLVHDVDEDGVADAGEPALASAETQGYVSAMTLTPPLPVALPAGSDLPVVAVLDVELRPSTGLNAGLADPSTWLVWLGLAVFLLCFVRTSPRGRRSAIAAAAVVWVFAASCEPGQVTTVEAPPQLRFDVTLPRGAIGGLASSSGSFASPASDLVGSAVIVTDR